MVAVRILFPRRAAYTHRSPPFTPTQMADFFTAHVCATLPTR